MRAGAVALLVTGLCPAQQILDDLELRAKTALESISRAHSREEADKARSELRRKLEESLGLRLLPWPPELRPKVTGTVRRQGYRIEKIVYQTLPGTLVPAHLYIPDGLKTRAPAVLFYPGHWWPDSKTRPDFQAFCIQMARFGFVVLAFDPFGQGERGISSRDHRRVEALLAGIAQQGIAEYETRCALEYLVSRPEVDPRRVGMTGASGGGYNTWITSALDDRIAAAAPVVGTSDFLEQIRVTRSLDWYHASEHCHFVPGLIRYANNHELLAMAAPKPLLIVAASKDQSFPIDGVRRVYEYGRGLYESYGMPEKISFFEDSSSGHGYQQKKREAAYGWFLKWLMQRGDGRPAAEAPLETAPFDAAELRCFPPGQNHAAGPGIVAAARAAAQRSGKHLPTRPAGRLDVPNLLLRASGQEKGIVIAADDRGKEALESDEMIREMRRNGWTVCGVDPRGIGELATSQMGWVAAVSLLLGENFVQQQAGDLVSASESFPGRPIAIYARGHNMALAACYAVSWQPRLAWFLLREGFLSFRQFIDRPKSLELSFRLQAEDKDRTSPFDREIPFAYVPFGALRAFDLGDLLASTQARGAVVDPIDGDWQPMAPTEARKLLPARVQAGQGTALPHLPYLQK